MKHSVASLLIMVFLSSTAHARFAELVHVAPGVEKDPRSRAYSISTNPVLTIVQSGTNTFTVTIPLKGTKQHQQYWVIRCKSPIEKGKVDFRDYVWGTSKRDDIENAEVIQLKPDQESLTLQIAAEALDRTYIFRDYPGMVMDGGYYYCFDLPAYYKKHKAEQSPPGDSLKAAPEE
jgi:hypothetical protein